MAITQTNTVAGSSLYTTDLIAATADTSFAIDNPFGAIANKAGSPWAGLQPQDITLTPLTAAGAKLSGWHLVSVTSTSVTVQKATTSLSASGGNPQVRVIIRRPHSLVR
jgi:hypothetical protein